MTLEVHNLVMFLTYRICIVRNDIVRWSRILNLSPNSFLFCWNSPFPQYQRSTCVSIRHNTIYTWRIHLYTTILFKMLSMLICADEYRQMIKILLCLYWHASYNTLFIPDTDTQYCPVPYLYWLEINSIFRLVCTLYWTSSIFDADMNNVCIKVQCSRDSRQ